MRNIGHQMTEDDFIVIVGKNIRKIRLAKGMKQVELAHLCDFETPNMRRIETGKNNLTLKSLYKIASSLDVKIEELIKTENPK